MLHNICPMKYLDLPIELKFSPPLLLLHLNLLRCFFSLPLSLSLSLPLLLILPLPLLLLLLLYLILLGDDVLALTTACNNLETSVQLAGLDSSNAAQHHSQVAGLLADLGKQRKI